MKILKYLVFLILINFVGFAQNKPYKAGEILSKQTFQYGKVEFRMRAAKASGVISNFFFYKNGSEQQGTFWEEIDIEVFGKNGAGSWQSNLITGNSGQEVRNEGVHNQAGLGDCYHTYTVEWKPNSVVWKVDGVVIRGQNEDTKNQAKDINSPASIRFNFWNPTIPDWVGPFNSSSLPLQMFLNWVRYYPYNNNGGFDSSPSWSDDFNNFDSSKWTKANFTFGENGSDFIPQNVVTKNGYLVLAMTRAGQSGYNGNPPTDSGCSSTSPDNNPPLAGSNSVKYSNSNPKSFSTRDTWTLSLDYTSNGENDIVGSIWDGETWKGGGRIQVSAGTGTRNITISSNSNLPVGENYSFRVFITARGGTWQSPGVVFGPNFEGVSLTNTENSVPSSSSNGLINNGVYHLISSTNNQRLIVTNREAKMAWPNSNNNQKWEFKNIGDNNYTIKNKGNNEYLEVSFARTANLSNVGTWTSAGSNHQKWEITKNGDYYVLKPLHAKDKSLDRAGGIINANAQIYNFWSGNNNQKWRIVATSAKSLNKKSSPITIYPNPVNNSEVITIETENKERGLVELYDLSGRRIYVNKFNNTSTFVIDVNEINVDKGIYILKVNTNTEQKIVKLVF